MKNRVLDWMNSSPIKVDKNESISTAYKVMKENNIHHLLVYDGGFFAGILSSDDLNLADSIRQKFKGIDTSLVRIASGDLMSRSPVTIDRESSMRDAVKLMGSKHFRSLPVTENGGAIVGILTQADVLRYTLDILNS